MKKQKSKISFSNFGEFITAYILAQIVAFAVGYIPTVFAMPFATEILIWLFGKDYVVTNAYMPVFTAMNICYFVIFYIVFTVMYLHRDVERKYDIQMHSKENFSLFKEASYYCKKHMKNDLLFYCICYIPASFVFGGGMERKILGRVTMSPGGHVVSIPIFIAIYYLLVLIVLLIWNKTRPKYLTKGYTEEKEITWWDL